MFVDRLLLHPPAFTPYGQSPHPLQVVPLATWANALTYTTSRSLLITPSYPAWTCTYATTVPQWTQVRLIAQYYAIKMI